jgi:hypothetical protein
MMTKIISGAQNGADQAGLRSAFDNEIPTGGYVSRNCRTLDGYKPHLIVKYNLIELPCDDYPTRTFKNVEDSDGTMRFASVWNSRGERCTLKAIKKYSKPHIDIDIFSPTEHDIVIRWIEDNSIQTLNIAGNSEKTCQGIGEFVYNYLDGLFKVLKNDSNR